MSTVNRRKLGGLDVSAIGLGCMGMSEVYGKVDRALDLGVNLLDTSASTV